MLSPVFWIVLAVVFLGLYGLASGMKSLFELDIRKGYVENVRLEPCPVEAPVLRRAA